MEYLNFLKNRIQQILINLENKKYKNKFREKRINNKFGKYFKWGFRREKPWDHQLYLFHRLRKGFRYRDVQIFFSIKGIRINLFKRETKTLNNRKNAFPYRLRKQNTYPL